MQFYTDPQRESDPRALPDAVVFHMTQQDFIRADADTWVRARLDNAIEGVGNNLQAAADLIGWYWWSCFPGCLPEGDPSGPFATEAQALADARDAA